MAQPVEVKVPDIGEVDGVEVAELLVAVGDQVAVEQSLISLESDKATMEVPSPIAGTVTEVRVAVGDQVSKGTPILLVQSTADSGDTESAPPPRASERVTIDTDAAPLQPRRERVIPEPSPRHAAEAPYASPAVRRLARERGVDLRRVQGSGRNGRITRSDVERQDATPPEAPQAAGTLPPMPQIDYAQFGEVEYLPLTRINRLTAESVHRSWLHVPHVTQHDVADITELEAFRKAHKAEAHERGTKLTFLSFLLTAAAAGLREFPRFNSSLAASGDRLVLKHYVNIGIAVDTPKGLVVPVIHDVPHKSIYELADELLQISSRARDGKLNMSDIQGGTFTVSSLGGIGGTAFTPIVNAPEVAILGVSRAGVQPVWDGGEFRPRLMLPLSLSYDHRVIDGAAAARFTTYLARLLGDLRTILL